MKRTATILTLALLLTAGTARAQIFLEEGEYNANRGEVINPSAYGDLELPDTNGAGTDYYLPIGNGIALLAALGGAYLLGKKKENK